MVDTGTMAVRKLLLALVVLAGCSSSVGTASDARDSTTTTSTPETSTTAPSTTETSTTVASAAETDSTAPEPSTTVETTTTSSSIPVADLPGTSGDPELDALVDELAAFVEIERGLNFERRPEIALLDSDEFADEWTRLISEDAAENAESFENFTNIYQTMGIISPDRTLEEIWTRFGDAGVLGYYDSETEQIRLRAGEINTLTKTVLAHELVHALEDQVFDLDRDHYSDRDDEISWAFSALVEGSARVIENRYRETLSEAERADENAALAALPRSVSFSEFTASFLELQFGRYNYGETFADALWAEGQSELDQTFIAPPTSSEQVLDPGQFLGGVDADSPVSPPPADGQIIEDGVWGEAAWVALLSDVVSLNEARDIANGWGGDWYVAWNEGDSTCVRVDLVADTDEELVQYETALERWSSAGDRRALRSPSPGLLRLDACG